MIKLLAADIERYKKLRLIHVNSKYSWLAILHPRFMPVVIIRVAGCLYNKNKFLRKFSFAFTWLNVFVFGIECTPRCKIGAGLCIPHSNGTVIGAFSIGSNATIFQGVTLGASVIDIDFSPEKRPVIADNVVIGAGAKVLGGVVVGSDSTIGANAVVVNTIASNSVAVGVPARTMLSDKT